MMLEIIVCSLILGSLSFVIGFFSTVIYTSCRHYKPKLYHYDTPPEFDIKTSIDKSFLAIPNSSAVDGDKALNNF